MIKCNISIGRRSQFAEYLHREYLDYLMGKRNCICPIRDWMYLQVPAMQLIMYQNRLDGAGNA